MRDPAKDEETPLKRGRGRPVVGDYRKGLNLRASVEDLARLKALAEKRQQTQAEVVRDLIREAAEREGIQ